MSGATEAILPKKTSMRSMTSPTATATRGLWEENRKKSLNKIYDRGSNDYVDASLKRLIRLLSHEHTVDLTERQLVVLRHLCKLRQQGFRYSELSLVETLLPLLESRVVRAHNSTFREPFFKLLNICSLAPTRDHASEECAELALIASSSLFRVLGGILRSSDGEIQAATADILRKIAIGTDPVGPDTLQGGGNRSRTRSGCWYDFRPKSRDINQALLLGCGVVAMAVMCLDTAMKSVLETHMTLDEFLLHSSSSSGNDKIKDTESRSLSAEAPNIQPKSDEEIDKPFIGAHVLEAEGHESEDFEEWRPVAKDDYGKTVAGVEIKYKVLISLLKFVRELSTDAASSAVMVQAGLISPLVQVVRVMRGVRDPALSITVEVLWNCLEHGKIAMTKGPPAESRTCLVRKARKTNAVFALSTWEGVVALRDAVKALLVGGFRNKDKELRNEVIIVASLLAGNGRSHSLFRSTGFLLLLLRYATVIETGLVNGYNCAEGLDAKTLALVGDKASGGGDGCSEVPDPEALANPRNFATVAEVDLELKLLLWSLLIDLCKKDLRNLDVVEASPLMETLLMYMDLVIEEGPSFNTSFAGVSRSVSLASMPPVRISQTASVTLGASAFTTARVEDSAKNPTGDVDVGIDPLNPTSAANNDPCISGCHPARPSEPHHRTSSLSKNVVSEVTSSCPVRDVSSGWKGKGANLSLELISQLYVPAAVMRLSTTSIKLLQGQAIASLLVLAPKCSTKFQALGGHMMTLRLLDRLGFRPENQQLVKLATRMLATVVGLSGLKEELGRVDGIRIILNRFSDAWRRGPYGFAGDDDEEQGGDVNCRSSEEGNGGGILTDTVVILCRLCKDCPENQDFFRKADGVSIMVGAIKAYIRARKKATKLGNVSYRSEATGIGREKVWAGSDNPSLNTRATENGSENSTDESLDPALVHIVDCVWCAIVGNRRSEARLLQCEGLDTLLDLLELCPYPMRHQVTGIVADLLGNKRAIPYAKAWRSDVHVLSITQMMMRLWIAEEARLGVSRPKGVLKNIWQPLQSHDRGTGCRGKHTEPPRHMGFRRSVSGTSRDPTTSTSGSDLASDDRFSQTKSCAVEDGTSRTPEVEEIGPIAENLVAGLLGTGNQEEVSVYPAIIYALQVCKRVTIPDQRNAVKKGKRVSTSGASVSKILPHLDLRGKVAAVLKMIGFEGSVTDELAPSDLKAAYMATSYIDFREGEAWQEVANTLKTQNINTIAADALVLDNMLERAFDRTQKVKRKQMALTAKQTERDEETEKAFFSSIFLQRDQEIRQAVIKYNASLTGTAKKRLATKKSSANIIVKQSERSAETSNAERSVDSKKEVIGDDIENNKAREPSEGGLEISSEK